MREGTECCIPAAPQAGSCDSTGDLTTGGSISLGYKLGGFVGGAFTPIIATELLSSTGASRSISLYLVALAAISFFSVFLLSETHSKDLSRIDDGSNGRGRMESGPATGSSENA